jgi:hypothetical protein
VDQNGALVHSRNVLSADDAATARRRDHVHGDGVGIGHQIGFADEAYAGFPGLGFWQVRTPSDNVHIERNGVAGYPRAKTTETDDAQRFAGEPHANRHATLEAAEWVCRPRRPQHSLCFEDKNRATSPPPRTRGGV